MLSTAEPFDHVGLMVNMVRRLQEWVEDRDGLATVPLVRLVYTEYGSEISIGDCVVFGEDDDFEDLTVELCTTRFIEYVERFRPFLSEDSPEENQSDDDE